MKHRRSLLFVLIALASLALFFAGDLGAGEKGTRHTIYMTLYEAKGSTTADKLAPPADDPKELSKGYGFKPAGQADKAAPQKWEVSSYMFNPAWVTVGQGDEVVLNVFVVNGDEHEAWVTAPDGSYAVRKTMWNRGREYTVSFRAEQAGDYQLACSSHAPSMVATIAVLPR